MTKTRVWLVACVVLVGVSFLLSGVVLAADAKPVKKEKKVTIDQVPAAVKETILKAAGDNKVGEIEEVVKDGVTTYEAEWVVGDKKTEVTVAADGKLLGTKTEDAKDKDDDKDGDNEDDD